MANTYTNLVADFYKALDVVSRELVGFIPAVARDSSAERCALNANAVRSPIVPINGSLGDVTAAMALPTAVYQTITNKTVQITKARYAPFSWQGEEEKALGSTGQFLTIKQNQIAQAIRALVNEMEVDLATAAYKGASRWVGTAGTTPFVSTLGASALVHKMLVDNGAPPSGDRSLIINTTAGASLRTLTQLTKVNEAGTADVLRQGVLIDAHGFMFRESAQIQTPAIGTAVSATTDNAGYAVGATTLTLASAGTGTLVAGDVVTFAGDTNQYTIVTGDTDVSNGGTFVLQEPGLRVAMSQATKAITVVAAAARNVGFYRHAIQFATRLPALPSDGDMATFRETIVDDRTGLAFELACYPGYRMNTYHVLAAWGQTAVKPEHIAGLLG